MEGSTWALFRKVALLASLLFTLTTSSYGQIDSLYNEVRTDYRAADYKSATTTLQGILDTLNKKDQANQIKARYFLISIYCYIDSCSLSEPYYDDLEAMDVKDDTLSATRLNAMAYYVYQNGEYQKAITAYESLFHQSVAIQKNSEAVKALIFKAMSENYVNQTDRSIKTLHKAYRLTDSLDLKPSSKRFRQFQILNEIGLGLRKSKDIEKSNSYFYKALAVDSLTGSNIANVEGNLAANYNLLEQSDSCILYANKVLDNAHARISTKVFASDDMIRSLIRQRKLREAKGRIDDLIKLIDDPSSSYYQKNVKSVLGEYLIANGRIKEGIKSYREALDYVEEYQPLSLRTKHSFAEAIVLGHYQSIGNAAYRADFDVYRASLDSLLASENRNEILNATIAYETRIKEDSLKNLKLQLENTSIKAKNARISSLAILFGLLTLSLLTILLYGRYRRSLKEKEVLVFEKNELENLNHQLNLKIQELKETAFIKEESLVLKFRSVDKVYALDSVEITHIVAEQNGCRVFFGGKTVWTDKTLKAFKEDLSKAGFVQVHRSTLVNIQHIEWVNHATLQLLTGESIKIGRTYKKDIKSAFH